MKKILPLFVLFTVLFTNCETNPPSSPDQNTISAQVTVNSNVDGAEIYLDNSNTGEVTPAVITVNEGTHEIRVEKDGYTADTKSVTISNNMPQTLTFDLAIIQIEKVVLLEDFSNESCGPCVASNVFIENLKNYRYGEDKLVSIKYATNFPGRNDPFYLASKSASDSRIQYYSVLFTPTIKVDGKESPISTDSNSVITSVDKRLLVAPDMELDVTGTVNGGNYEVAVKLDINALGGFDTANSVLHIVVTETDIPHNAPNGENMFFDVARAMLPSHEGTSLANISAAGEFNYSQNINIDPSWNTSKIHVVAFVQNNSTKEVYQTGSNH